MAAQKFINASKQKSVPVTIFCSGVYKEKDFAIGRRRAMDTLPMEDRAARFGPDRAMPPEKYASASRR